MSKHNNFILNEQEIEQAKQWAKDWMQLALGTDEADWKTSEEGIREGYAHQGKEWHNNYIRCPNPFIMSYAAPIAAALLEADVHSIDLDFVNKVVGGRAKPETVRRIHALVNQTMDGAPKRGPEKENPYSPANIWSGVQTYWSQYVGGRTWIGWVAYESFYRHIGRTHDKMEECISYEKAQKSSFWWWPHRDFVMVVNNPCKIEVEPIPGDERGALQFHCEDGPAIQWSDGWGACFWHGVRVPRFAIEEPEKLTVDCIKSKKNMEVRRSLMEIFGYSKYFIATNAEIIDTDEELCRVGAAPRMLIRDEDGQVWLFGTDGGTKRMYYMRVTDEGVKTCKQAHESISGLDDESRIVAKS